MKTIDPPQKSSGERAERLPELLEYLYALRRLGIKVGLEHTRRLLDRCGNPHHSFPAIHIAGTNGKGSTAAMIAKILQAAGYRVGLYTSPHLVRFNERIRVDGVPITDQELIRFVERHRDDFDEIETTFFEATTALAFWYFARRRVDLAVVETGLGGRLDSTNVLTPVVTVITPVGLDHRDLLGPDLTTIAAEKGGIIKENVPLILAPQPAEVRVVLRNRAVVQSAPVTEIDSRQLQVGEVTDRGTRFVWQGQDYRTALMGHHQAVNAVVAIEAVRALAAPVTEEAVVQGLAQIQWPGRLQRLDPELPIYYDVAHNGHGIRTVARVLRACYPERPLGVLSLKVDKEVTEIAPVLQEHFADLVVTSVPGAGVLPAHTLASALKREGVSCRVIPHLETAVADLQARVDARRPGLIFGSHYIGGTVYRAFDFSFDNGVI
jgi:dihydrofolate synthase/folylpolyglutamate synthase